MSRALVENDKKNVGVIKAIITKHFTKNAQLYKEFRLFNALIRTSGVSDSLAARILGETQKAAQNHDDERLDKEKSALIKDINYTLNESDFYAQRVPDYVNYATIQSLLNGWRSSLPDIKKMAAHEKKIHEWLQRPSDECILENHQVPKINDLTVTVMQNKFMKKYNNSLTERQKVIMHAYLMENSEKLTTELEKIERDISRVLRKYKKVGRNDILLEKTQRIQAHVKEIALEPNHEGTVRGMVLCQLLREIKGEINER